MNNYHKIIGSSIFGFEDFSILRIEGKYADVLKGSYETFSQFISKIPESFWRENFIVWEGYIDELETGDHNRKTFMYDGTVRKLNENELFSLIRKNPVLPHLQRDL